ncbi:MAG: hypothetical protein ACI8P9_005686, partial [Parasphingorhabdus sp.]
SLGSNHYPVIFLNKTSFERHILSIFKYVRAVSRSQVSQSNPALIEPDDGMATAHMRVANIDMTFPANNIWLSFK